MEVNERRPELSCWLFVVVGQTVKSFLPSFHHSNILFHFLPRSSSSLAVWSHCDYILWRIFSLDRTQTLALIGCRPRTPTPIGGEKEDDEADRYSKLSLFFDLGHQIATTPRQCRAHSIDWRQCDRRSHHQHLRLADTDRHPNELTNNVQLIATPKGPGE